MTPQQQLATFKVLHLGSNTLTTFTYFRPLSLDCVIVSSLLLLPLFSSLNTVASDTVKIKVTSKVFQMFSISFIVKIKTFTVAYKVLHSLNPLPQVILGWHLSLTSLRTTLFQLLALLSSHKHSMPTSGSLYLLFTLLGRPLPSDTRLLPRPLWSLLFNLPTFLVRPDHHILVVLSLSPTLFCKVLNQL